MYHKFDYRPTPYNREKRDRLEREAQAARETCERDVCYYPRCSCYEGTSAQVKRLPK